MGSKWWRWRACGVWAKKKRSEWMPAFYVERHFKALRFQIGGQESRMIRSNTTLHNTLPKTPSNLFLPALGSMYPGRQSQVWGSGGSSCERSVYHRVPIREKDGGRQTGGRQKLYRYVSSYKTRGMELSYLATLIDVVT